MSSYICCVALCRPHIGLIVELRGPKFTELLWIVLRGCSWVICLVLVPGKLPGNVAGRRKNMSNVLKIVWLCLKTKTRLSLRNSKPLKIFIAIKQSNGLWLGPCLLWNSNQGRRCSNSTSCHVDISKGRLWPLTIQFGLVFEIELEILFQDLECNHDHIYQAYFSLVVNSMQNCFVCPFCFYFFFQGSC